MLFPSLWRNAYENRYVARPQNENNRLEGGFVNVGASTKDLLKKAETSA